MMYPNALQSTPLTNGITLWLRFVFAATLFAFFFRSALTKFGDGISGLWTPSLGAYAQIFPKKFEQANYNTDAMSVFDSIIALGAAYGELILPIFIIVGLCTRLSAFLLIIFIIVMSYVDITGHGVTEGGMLFDKDPYGIIADDRLYWVTVLMLMMAFGAGKFSLDYFLRDRVSPSLARLVR